MSYVAGISPPTHLGRSYGWYTTALYVGMSLGPAAGGFVAHGTRLALGPGLELDLAPGILLRVWIGFRVGIRLALFILVALPLAKGDQVPS